MKQKPQQPEQDGIFEKYQQVKWFTQFPALSVVVLLRRDCGYRYVNPLYLAATTIALCFIGILAQPDFPEAHTIALVFFGLLSFVAGIYQRIRRWLDLNRTLLHSTEYIGSSPLEFSWLPNWCLRNRRMARFADPVFCIILGAMAYPLSHALCGYLCFSGFCLRAFEHQIHHKELNRDLDLMDGLIRSQYQAEVVEHFEGNENAGPRSSAPIPTGIASDIQSQVQNLKKHTSTNQTK